MARRSLVIAAVLGAALLSLPARAQETTIEPEDAAFRARIAHRVLVECNRNDDGVVTRWEIQSCIGFDDMAWGNQADIAEVVSAASAALDAIARNGGRLDRGKVLAILRKVNNRPLHQIIRSGKGRGVGAREVRDAMARRIDEIEEVYAGRYQVMNRTVDKYMKELDTDHNGVIEREEALDLRDPVVRFRRA